MRRHVSRPDRWLMRRSAALPPTSADGLLRTLSVSANHNRLWFVAGAALYLLGGPTQRRAAVRGLAATGIASGLANGVAKPLFPRRRPPGESVPVVRRLLNPPVSSSFPSGHSASAAAFTVGVAVENPAAAAVIAPVAVAVAYSRVHVGVHWPTDVLAGIALGSAIALATRRWWPLRAESVNGAMGPHETISEDEGFALSAAVGPDGDTEPR